MDDNLPEDKATPPLSETDEEHIRVGDISQSQAIAIGAGATAVYQGLSTEEVAALVVELKRIDQPAVWDGRIPYLGLAAFREEDAQFFFGRESLVDDLLQHLKQFKFIVIAGPSGSGKSSFVRAGLFYALRQGRIERSDTWLLGTMQPRGDPIEQLADAVARVAKSPAASDYIRQKGLANPQALSQQLETLLTDDPRQRCILLVDQFEEIFTQTKDENTQAAFIDLLIAAAEAEGGRIIIVICLRSDFVSPCARFPKLRALMSQQFQLVGGMVPQDLAKAITLPALEVGAQIDPALVSQIMTDMKGEPGALPLMSFALRDLFEKEKTKRGEPMDLTLTEYLNRGGIESALERHANDAFATFSPDQQALAQNIFSKLIEVGQGRVDTRRTATFAELVPAGANVATVTEVVSKLAAEDVRLITMSGADREEAIEPETSARTTVTLAHEKLIDAWPWLRQLVDENREVIALQNQVNTDAQAWSKTEDPGYLYRGGRLLQVEEKLAQLQPNLDVLSQNFIEASLSLREREMEEKEAQRRKTIAILTSASVIAFFLATIAFLFFLRSNENAQAAEVNLATATAALIEAQSARGTAEAEATRALIAEGIAQANLEIARTRQAEAIAANSTATFNETLANDRLLEIDSQKELAEIEAEANGLFALALQVEQENPTLSMRILEKALHISRRPGILQEVEDWYRGKQFYNMQIHHRRIEFAYFSPDGQYIMTSGSGSQDGTGDIILWNLQGEKIRTITDAGPHAQYSPNGEFIFSSTDIGPPRLYETETGELVRILDQLDIGWTMDIAYSPNGEHVLVSDTAYNVLLGDVNGNILVPLEIDHDSFVQHRGVTSMAFSPDGESILTGSDDHVARLWDVSGELIRSFEGHRDYVESVAFSADGSYMLTASIEGKTQVWDEDGREIIAVEGQQWYGELATFTPRGNTFLTLDRNNTINLWDLGGNVLQTFRAGHSRIIHMTVSNDGQLLLAASEDGNVYVWPIKGLQTTASLPTGCVHALAFSPGGEWIVTGSRENCLSKGGSQHLVGYFDTSARLWGFQGELLHELETPARVNDIVFSEDNEHFLTCSGGTQSHLWDLEGNLSHHFDNATCPALFSPDGKQLLVNDPRGKAKLLNLEGELINTFGFEFENAAFSPDGKYFAVNEGDEIVTLYDTVGNLLRTIETDSNIHHLTFANDGESILVTGAEISRWDLQGDQIGSSFDPEQPFIHTTIMMPNDEQIVTIGYSEIRVWELNGTISQKFESRGTAYIAAKLLPNGGLVAGTSSLNLDIYMILPPLEEYLKSDLLADFDAFDYAIAGVDSDFEEILSINDPEQLYGYSLAFLLEGTAVINDPELSYLRAFSDQTEVEKTNVDFLQKAKMLAEKSLSLEHNPEVLLTLLYLNEQLGQDYSFDNFIETDDAEELSRFADYFVRKAGLATNSQDEEEYLNKAILLYEKLLTIEHRADFVIDLYAVHERLGLEFDESIFLETSDSDELLEYADYFLDRGIYGPDNDEKSYLLATQLYEKLLELGIEVDLADAATAYGNLAWAQILSDKPGEAELSARRGIELDSSKIWIQINLAHALLLSGQSEAALDIYRDLKDVLYDSTTLGEATLNDFLILEERGIVIQNIDEIRLELESE